MENDFSAIELDRGSIAKNCKRILMFVKILHSMDILVIENIVKTVWGTIVSILFHLVFQRFIAPFITKSELESKSWLCNIAAFNISSVQYKSLRVGMRPSSGIHLANLSLNLRFNSWIMWS